MHIRNVITSIAIVLANLSGIDATAQDSPNIAVRIFSSLHVATAGEPVSFVVRVSPSRTTGSIAYFLLSGATVIHGGSAMVANDQSNFSVTPPVAGSYVVRVVFTPAGAQVSATDSLSIEAVSASPEVSVRIFSSLHVATAGEPVSFVVRVSPSGTTGSIAYFLLSGATVIHDGSAMVANDQSNFSVTPPVAGSYVVRVVFTPAGSQSRAEAQITLQAESATVTFLQLFTSAGEKVTNTDISISAATDVTGSNTQLSYTVSMGNREIESGTTPVVKNSANIIIRVAQAGRYRVQADIYLPDGRQISDEVSFDVVVPFPEMVTLISAIVGEDFRHAEYPVHMASEVTSDGGMEQDFDHRIKFDSTGLDHSDPYILTLTLNGGQFVVQQRDRQSHATLIGTLAGASIAYLSESTRSQFRFAISLPGDHTGVVEIGLLLPIRFVGCDRDSGMILNAQIASAQGRMVPVRFAPHGAPETTASDQILVCAQAYTVDLATDSQYDGGDSGYAQNGFANVQGPFVNGARVDSDRNTTASIGVTLITFNSDRAEEFYTDLTERTALVGATGELRLNIMASQAAGLAGVSVAGATMAGFSARTASIAMPSAPVAGAVTLHLDPAYTGDRPVVSFVGELVIARYNTGIARATLDGMAAFRRSLTVTCGPFKWIEDSDGLARTYIRISGSGQISALTATLGNSARAITGPATQNLITRLYDIEMSESSTILPTWQLDRQFGHFVRADVTISFQWTGSVNPRCFRISRSSPIQAIASYKPEVPIP